MILPRALIIPLLLIAIFASGPLKAEEAKPALPTQQAAGSQPAPPAAPSVVELAEEARHAYASRHEMASMKRCLALYQQALGLSPDNWQLNLEYATAVLWLEGYHSGKETQDEKLILSGLQAAQKAVELQPGSVLAHYAYALLNGFYGKYLDSLSSFTYFGYMDEGLKWVSAHDPNFDYGGVYRARGRYYSQLPGVLGGDDAKARDFYEQARQASPEYMLNDVLIAELCIEQNRLEEARALLQPVLDSTKPADASLTPEWHMWQLRAEVAMNRLPQSMHMAVLGGRPGSARQNTGSHAAGPIQVPGAGARSGQNPETPPMAQPAAPRHGS